MFDRRVQVWNRYVLLMMDVWVNRLFKVLQSMQSKTNAAHTCSYINIYKHSHLLCRTIVSFVRLFLHARPSCPNQHQRLPRCTFFTYRLRSDAGIRIIVMKERDAENNPAPCALSCVCVKLGHFNWFCFTTQIWHRTSTKLLIVQTQLFWRLLP